VPAFARPINGIWPGPPRQVIELVGVGPTIAGIEV